MKISVAGCLAVTAMVLCGCATAAQRQFTAMRTGNAAAVAARNACAASIYNSPEAAPIRAHLPIKIADLTLRQLSDPSFATPEETAAIYAAHAKGHVCRTAFLEAISKTEPALVPPLVATYNKTDDNTLALAQRKESWGEYARRQRDLNAESMSTVREADHRVVTELRRENAVELERRRRAAEALAQWAQTQELINAANRPVVTTCSGFSNTVNCVSR